MQRVYIPNRFHLLKGIQKEVIFGTFHNEHSYVLSFSKSNDALHVCRHITMESSVEITSYKPTDIHLSETNYGEYIEIYFKEPSIIRVNKNHSPNWEWIIENVSVDETFTFPIKNNIGVVIPYKQINEDDKQITFESYIIDPMPNTDVFRIGLYNQQGLF